MMQTTFYRHIRTSAMSASLTLLLGACVATDPTVLSQAELAATGDADKLLIVDCLLPGQVRKLGTKATYVTARRPIKTTASLCEIRGGEYTAYDRADLRTALNVWLPGAQAGDPEAQSYVGELYEKGIGVSPDYSAAAQWYRKAADQGNSRAQTNLGHLYEQGQGVSVDKVAALNWYRRASGLGNDELAFTSSIAALQAQIDSSSQRAAAAEREAGQLRGEIQQLESQVSSQRSQRDATERELARVRRALERPAVVATAPRSAPTNDAEIKRLKQQLASQTQQQSEAEKKAQLLQARLEADNQGAQALQGQLSSLEQQLAASKAEKQRLETAARTLLTQRGESLKQARSELERVRQALEQQQQSQSNQSDAEAARLRQELQSSSQRIGELEASLAASQQRDAAEVDLDVQKSKLIEARRELQRTRQQLQQQTSGESDEVRRLNEQLQEQERKLQEKENQIQTLIEKVADSRQELAATQGQIEALEGEAKVVNDLIVTRGRAEEPVLAKPPAVEFGRYFALVIGNNSYADFPNLQTAVNDARAITNVLQSDYGFKSQLLTNANRYQVLTALNKYRETLTEQDNFLLYYAGHGEYDRSNTRGHWLPVDAEAGSTANWIANDQITDILNTMSAKHVMVIADSCYSGALTRAVTTSIEGGRSTEKQVRWLKLMAETRSRTVLSSGGLKPVLDGGGGDHSVFAKQLLQVLRSNKQILEGPLLYRAVSRRVKSAASRLGVSQDPQYSPIKFAGDLGAPFFFKPKSI